MNNCTETLGIGSRVPDFRLQATIGGDSHSLAQWTARGAVMLEFLRGTWCPNCRKRMMELQEMSATIWSKGGNLVCIAAEKRDGMWEPEKFLRSNPYSFPLLLDEDRSVIKAYGLFHRVGIDAWNIAHPATLIIDRDSRVRYIYKGSTQSDRAPMAEVLKALSKVTGL
jgi:peroxiredoxin Q/BCP